MKNNEKIRRQWGQWKRRYLSKKEKKNLNLGMVIDFLCCKGYKDKITQLIK